MKAICIHRIRIDLVVLNRKLRYEEFSVSCIGSLVACDCIAIAIGIAIVIATVRV